MLVPDLQTIIEQTGGQTFAGVLHIGAHVGEEASKYAAAGIRHALWIEANTGLMKTLYDNTKFHPIRSQYLNVMLSENNNDELILQISNKTEFSSELKIGDFVSQNMDVKIVSQVPTLTKKFETVYRENNANIDLSKFDFVRVATNGTELSVLKGFGSLFNIFPFRTVSVTSYEQNIFQKACDPSEVEQLMNLYGFKRILTTLSDYKSELLYTRNV